MARKPLKTGEDNLTDRERKMLLYMKTVAQEKGYPPTVREICSYMGIKSTSTCHKDLENLENKGFIRKDPAKPRAIEIVSFDRYKSPVPKGDPIKLTPPANVPREVDRPDVLNVPVVGRIAAGTPILAEQNIEETFPVPTSFISGGSDHFMLIVKGESMIEAGILDGDYILVRGQNTANNGQIVVAMIDGFESEATVKTFYKENGHIRLQPENSTMDPIIVNDVKILGLVKGVFRHFN